MTAIRDQDPIASLSRISDADAANRLNPNFHAEFLESILATDPTEPIRKSANEHAPQPRRQGDHKDAPVKSRHWATRRPLLLAGTFAAAVATLVLILPGLFSDGTGGSPQNADAAILRQVQAAVSAKPGRVLVVKMKMYISGGKTTKAYRAGFNGSLLTVTELTPRGGGAMTELATSSLFFKPGVQEVQSGRSSEIYDPYRNMIYRSTKDGNASSKFVNPEKWIANQLREHRYHVVGDVTLNGRRAVEIASTDGKTLIYADRTTYQPLRTVEVFGDQETETIDYIQFELLPATAANARLVKLADLHPGARTVTSEAAYVAAESRLGLGTVTTSLSATSTTVHAPTTTLSSSSSSLSQTVTLTARAQTTSPSR